MMNVGNKYAGNNRQDYSLVDRFAGSYYTLEKNKEEATLVYPYVYNISDAIRDFLNSRQVIQSVSLRTMLNFNRTYEQEMLSLLESPFADEIFDNDGKKMKPKTIENSIDSFKSMLDPNTQKDLENDDTFKKAMKNKPSASQFILEFMRKYHLNPLDKRSVEFREVEVVKDGKKQVEIQVFYTDDEKRVIY
jgi:cobaltochelatase CobS